MIPGLRAAHALPVRGFKPQACSARTQILRLYAPVVRPLVLNRCPVGRWQPWYASRAARVPTNVGFGCDCELIPCRKAGGPKTTYACLLADLKQIALLWSTTRANEASDDA